MERAKKRFLSSFLLSLLMITGLTPHFVYQAQADATNRNEGFYNQTYEISGNRLSFDGSSQNSSSSGAYSFSLPLTLPPGRSGLQPSLALGYNSQSRNVDNFFGYGWSMDFPSITRLNKTGLNNLYDEIYFSSSLSGELVNVNGTPYGDYETKYENGSFLLYEFNSDDSWTVTDKSGTVYTFGSTADTRQDDSADTTHIYKWMLEEVRDTNDNYLSYSYYKEGGQMYPNSIGYTGNGTTDGIFTVDFTLESRSDTTISFQTGFEVDTNYRVSEVSVSIDGTERHSYAFGYTTPDNTPRSLLESVTEAAVSEDGTVVTMEPTSFEYTESAKTWTSTSGYTIPVYFYMSGDNDDKGVEVADVNGDGFMDLVNSFYDGNGTQKVYLNAGGGSGWFEDSSFTIPVYFWDSSGNLMRNTRMADVNGDGFSDIFYGGSGTTGLYRYDETVSAWTSDASYSLPLSFNNGYLDDQGIRLLDINGDEFPDFVQSLYDGSGKKQSIYLFDPVTESWDSVSSPSIPVYFNNTSSNEDEGSQLTDVNGDGLVDIVLSYYDGASYQGVYLNRGDGTGWSSVSGYTIPAYFWESNGTMMPVANIADVDGDSLGDIVVSSGSNSSNGVYINQGDGTGWEKDTSYSVPVYFSNGYLDYEGVQMVDVDGDNFMDFVQSKSSGATTRGVYLSDSEPELLETVNHSKGATTTVTYAPSTEWDNPDLPFAMNLVSSITVEDGLGDTATTSYDYEGGVYLYEDEFNRQFAGFSSITKTEGGRTVETFYEQDSLPLLGHAYQTDLYDNSGNLYSRSIDTWETSDLGYDNDFVYKSQTATMTYDGRADGSHRDSGAAYTYDSNGNVKTVVDYGEVTASEDGSFTDVTDDDEKLTVTYTYATDSSGGEIRNKVKQEAVSNEIGGTEKKTRYYYDSLTLGNVSTGNLTKQSVWDDQSNTWFNTTYAYNSYGLVTSVKNPRNYTTSFTYDSYYLYPATTTNPKLYTVSMEYDYNSGQVTSRTDENGSTYETSYDGLGRVLTVSLPDPSTGTLTTFSETSYGDSSIPSSVTTTSTVDGVTSENVTYLDGLGRTVQTNTLAEDSVYTTLDIWYDELGNVSEQTLPYETSSSAYGRDDTQYSVTSTYDALNRPTAVTDPNGTTTYDYDQWENTVTDSSGVSKVFIYDAAGRLLAVEEQNDSETYTTTYEYDPTGELVTLTDAQGNERNFEYDSLSRKISQEDLHDPSETDFGIWTYTYDKNGNLLKQTDPAGTTITWAYDKLDRPSYEDWDTSTTNRDISYTYDSAANGKGKVYKVRKGDFTITYDSYDALGNLTKETRKIGASSYAFQTSYDLLSRPTELIYPSSILTVTNTYNEAGFLETVSSATPTETAMGTSTVILSDIDYSPMDQTETMTYGNGVTTTNTFSADEAYRLTNKTTTGIYSDGTDADGDGVADSTSGSIQSLAYTYDNVGNITGIVDDSITPTAKTVSYSYDDLNRLLSASTSGLTSSSNAGGDFTESYEYDSVGNLTYKSNIGDLLYEGTGSSSGTYSGANPHAVTSVAGTAYSYDSNGNLTSNRSHSYSWDQRNRLSSSGSKTFSYDAAGSRYKTTDRSSGSAVYTYYLSPYEEIHEATNTEAGTPTYYIFAGPQRVAAYEDSDGDGSSEMTYYHQDHLGGTALATDEEATVVQLYDYYPYGSELLNSQPTSADAPSEHSFTDKELDDDLGFYYFEARWYDSEIGRFSSQDPAQLDDRVFKLIQDPQSLNFYAYSRNNPVNLVDPTGEYLETPLDMISLGLSLLVYFENPSVGNLFWLSLDIAAFASPVPAITGYMRHGDTALKIANYFSKISEWTGKSALTISGTFLKNINFNQTKRAWSQGEAGQSLANLVGHYEKHGAEVGAKSLDEYYNKANDFLDSGNYKSWEEGGTTVHYNADSNTAVYTDTSGNIQSMYTITDETKYLEYQNTASSLE